MKSPWAPTNNLDPTATQEEVLIQAPSTSSVARVDDLGRVCSTLISPFSTSFTCAQEGKVKVAYSRARGRGSQTYHAFFSR